MDHFKKIYTRQADKYHRLIQAEDIDGNLLPALEKLGTFSGKRVLDLGSGTGRIPLLLHGKVKQIVALDFHLAMLTEQQKHHNSSPGWGLLQGDIRCLPFPDYSFDIVTAGWALGHFVGWFSPDWKTQIGEALREMMRVVNPGGGLLIIETLTTGSLIPAPPTQGLAEYYEWLENQWGFSRHQIRTDYQFGDLAEAVEYTNFFFGEQLAQEIKNRNWIRLPEWTGVWGRKLD